VQRSGTDTGTKLGRYGPGTLWFLKNRDGDFHHVIRSVNRGTVGGQEDLGRDCRGTEGHRGRERNCKSSTMKGELFVSLIARHAK
jgi:hypothetical protein